MPASGPKKVLHFISSSGLFGAEQVLLTLCRGADRSQYELIVAALEDQRSPNTAILQAAEALGIATFKLSSRGRFDLAAVKALLELLRSQQIDLIHSHNYKSNMIAWLASLRQKVALLSTAHGYTGVSTAVKMYEACDRWILRNFFDRVVVVADSILFNWVSQKKVTICNGIDIQRYKLIKEEGNSWRKKWGIAPDDLVIGSVGRLSLEKNYVLLLKAVLRVLKANSKVKVLLVGDGPQRQELSQFINEHGLQKRVILAGLQPNTAPLYQVMDIFVLCSTTEGVPMVLAEAMAAGVPIIATKVGGVSKMLEEGKNGCLVDSQDELGLTEALEELLAKPEKRAQLIINAQLTVENNYSASRMCKQYQQLYEEILR